MLLRGMISLLSAALAAAGFVGGAAADAVGDFYRGKTVTIVVAAGPGGAHTKYSQLLAPFLKKYMPGNPDFVTQNMGGAGGTRAANFLYNTAPQDGTSIGILLSDTPLASRLEATGVKYVTNKFHFLGGADQPLSAFILFKSEGIASIDDAKKKEIVLGSTGKGSQTYTVPTMTNAMLGTKFKVITGYQGMGGVYLAMDRREVFGFQGVWESVKFLRPQWVANGDIKIIAAVSLKPLPDMPDVPLLQNMVSNPVDKQAIELMGGNAILGRGWLAPPGVPADRVAALRDAFRKSFDDPAAKAEAEKRKMPWDNATWQEMQEQAERIVKADDAVIKRMRETLGVN
jgi:tripartite-type tricarboxylate transporter receptor subunit TctC